MPNAPLPEDTKDATGRPKHRRGRNWALLGVLALLLFTVVAGLFASSRPVDRTIYVVFSEEADPSDAERWDALTRLGLRADDPTVHVVREAFVEILADVDRLGTVLQAIGRQQDPTELFILFERPTAGSKKRLRQSVDAASTGARRAEIQRRIVPVVTREHYLGNARVSVAPAAGRVAGMENEPDPGAAQFCDDVVFASDNFAGIGILIDHSDTDALAWFAHVLHALECR